MNYIVSRPVAGLAQCNPAIAGDKPTRVPKLSSFCRRCNAWLGCFGLEPTYQLYIEHTVEIFREVWRVLRNDGTLWRRFSAR